MFGLFKKKTPQSTIDFYYDTVGVDLHSHVLPGLDDGAQDIEESVVLVRHLIDLGIKKIITTPHIMVDYFKNDVDTIYPALAILKKRLAEEKIEIEIEAAAEHFYDEVFEQRVADRKALTFGDDFVLFELSFVSKPRNVIEIIQRMIAQGYKPVLAHPERYPYYDLDQFQSIREWGCALQLNTISLTGYYGRSIKERAQELVDAGFVDFISSDMHHPRHAEAMENALREPYLKKLIQSGVLRNKELL